MRILLVGTSGQVGFELASTLAPLGEVHGFDFPALDLADPDSIVAACRAVRPSLIVNAAAYTAVDKAESEPALAQAINGTAPGILAEEAKRGDAVLVHYSTDYVFDGSRRTPYREDDAPAPLNEYGRSKLAGDRAIAQSGCKHLIFRTTWVYGPRGRNFLLTMLSLAQTREEIRVVGDQQGAPTTSLFLAQATARALSAIPKQGVISGIYNLSASGKTTWAGFARAIFDRAKSRPGFRAPRVVAIATSDYPTPARRPPYSVLSQRRFTAAFGFAPSSWQVQLDACFARMPGA
ncbi:MAG: dTDP-4-dehydrorhamnose reductase [Betaproteobacteria bacterium]|nr:dTDP-4-dehydrorhamnose reductase [Betaproteobacteria bacterium]